MQEQKMTEKFESGDDSWKIVPQAPECRLLLGLTPPSQPPGRSLQAPAQPPGIDPEGCCSTSLDVCRRHRICNRCRHSSLGWATRSGGQPLTAEALSQNGYRQGSPGSFFGSGGGGAPLEYIKQGSGGCSPPNGGSGVREQSAAPGHVFGRPSLAESRPKTDPQISGQTASKYPD
jgi:hypothetical protein